jgi:hypothetical protein
MVMAAVGEMMAARPMVVVPPRTVMMVPAVVPPMVVVTTVVVMAPVLHGGRETLGRDLAGRGPHRSGGGSGGETDRETGGDDDLAYHVCSLLDGLGLLA